MSSVTEEEPKSPFSSVEPAAPRTQPPSPLKKSTKDFTTQSLNDAHSLGDIYHMLSSANSQRYEDQRSPPPSISPDDECEHMMDDEDGKEAVNVLSELDDFLDLLNSSTSDRMEHQRGPPPASLVTKSKAKNSPHCTVPKYYLSTSSGNCLTTDCSMSRRLRDGRSPPAYSMPDLTAESLQEVEECDFDDENVSGSAESLNENWPGDQSHDRSHDGSYDHQHQHHQHQQDCWKQSTPKLVKKNLSHSAVDILGEAGGAYERGGSDDVIIQCQTSPPISLPPPRSVKNGSRYRTVSESAAAGASYLHVVAGSGAAGGAEFKGRATSPLAVASQRSGGR